MANDNRHKLHVNISNIYSGDFASKMMKSIKLLELAGHRLSSGRIHFTVTPEK